MKKLKLKLMLGILFFTITTIISTSVLATNGDVQILQKSEKNYMIYLSKNIDTPFEFAFSNDKEVNKEELIFKSAAMDTTETNANYIAYVDEEIYAKFFNKQTFLWARSISGEYFVEAMSIDLSKAIKEKDVEHVNNITQIIKVNTKNSITTEKTENDVKITKTVGKVDVLEEGTTYYQLVKLPNSENYNKFMNIAEKIANSKIENDMYSRLEVTDEFLKLYNDLVPEEADKNWLQVTDNTILQPEESKNGEQYILWLKNVSSKGETKLDVQFLTCFEDYKPEVISEKVVSKLPITYDNPILFIILAILIIAFVIVMILKIKDSKRKETK